eukprot:gnl/TRDRNA2_/TRDRNA2_71486_c0_seq1.p1 gnl/TRDRNA2_/TRDRNA2_71486_c0~~gnl/TRDRNA2_/TRDRNA2_71486_c0_seq1.p1  ORF type:complete len:282 (+),score=39.44 gnl/TRDRNA2_/TRDRNA2_71486_c0_seq1:1-846(+)
MMGDCEKKSSVEYMRSSCRSSCRFCQGDDTGRAPELYRSLEQSILREHHGVFEEASFDPRVYVFDHFFSETEADMLKAYAEPLLKPSRVIDPTTGESAPDNVRTNLQMYVNDSECREHPLVSELIKRMHRLARVPLGHGELLQVGRYRAGEFYEPHFDSSIGLRRSATVIVYLAVPNLAGGETIFPKDKRCSGQGFQACCNDFSAADPGTNMVWVTPQKGRALLFYSYDLDGRHNSLSLHGSCPVVSGEKWIAQQWFHSEAFDGSPHYVRPNVHRYRKSVP